MKRRKWSKSLVRSAPISLTGGPVGSVLFLLLAVVAIGFSSYAPDSVSNMRSFASDRFAPVMNFITKPMQDATIFVRDVSGIANLQAENARLEQENIRLRQWYQAAVSLEAENESLRKLLNLKVSSQSNYITARILGDAGYTFMKSVLVYAGQQDGVVKGQAVISGDGVIGRVIETGENSSRVLLLTDINSRVPVMIEGVNQHAILAGNNKNAPVLEHLPPGFEPVDGRRIITSGQGGLFPYGLPVGRINLDNEGIAGVELFADLNQMMHVRIIDQPADPNLRRASSLNTN